MSTSLMHEMFVEIFREHPDLVTELLSGPLGITVPAYEAAHVSTGDLTAVAPTEYRADVVVTFRVKRASVLAVVVEIQLGPDPRKRRSWPAYVVNLYARHACPALLVVVCLDPELAGWCATPIAIGHPGFVLAPLVLGPQQIPLITDAESTQHSPELVLLSAITHARQAGRVNAADQHAILEVALTVLEGVDQDRANLYTDVLLAMLPVAARAYLEKLMTTTHRYRSDFARRYFDEGEARGEARSVLAVLDARGVAVPADVRERIASCTDLDQLNLWIQRAANAQGIDELFD